MFHDGFTGGMWFGWIFWIVLIVLAVWFIINQSKKSNLPDQQEAGLDILKKRYAKGEITKEQFEEMKSTLEK